MRNWIEKLLIIAMPLAIAAYLPVVDQANLIAKWLVAISLLLLVLVAYLWRTWSQRSINLIVHPLSLPSLVLAGSVLASMFATSPYPHAHLAGLGGVMIAGLVVVLLGPTLIHHQPKGWWTSLAVTAMLTAVIGVASAMGLMPNLVGSALIGTQVLLVILVIFMVRIWQTKNLDLISQLAISASIAGLGLFGWQLLPGGSDRAILLPFAASWSVAIDSLRLPQTALFGTGPEGFTRAYLMYKPMWLNATEYWNILFTTGRNLPLHLVVTSGLISLAAWSWWWIKLAITANSQHRADASLVAGLLVILACQLLFPPSPLLFILAAILTTIYLAADTQHHSLLQIKGFHLIIIHPNKGSTIGANSGGLIALASLLLIATIGSIGYLTARMTAAEVVSYRATTAFTNNNAEQVYRYHRQAANYNLFNDKLRRQLSQTNLALASGLAAKGELSSEDSAAQLQFIQDAIGEAKAATTINPGNAQNWANLATIYRNLIGSVDGAMQWTIASYLQAIELDPTNPNLRLELGGVLYQDQKYADAATLFSQAVSLKPDFASANYSLANSLRQLGQLQQSMAVYQQTLKLLPADSETYIKVNQEMQDLEKKLQEMGVEEKTESASESGEVIN